MKTSGAMIVLVTLLSFNLLASSSNPDQLGFRLDLTHVDADKGYTRAQLLTRAVHRSKNRAKRLSDRLKGPINAVPSEGEYLLELGIGTPPSHFRGILDTGSNLIWTQCTTCVKCAPQPTPYFDPFHSPTFSYIPCTHKLCRYLARVRASTCAANFCMYEYAYGDDTLSFGFMGTDTFTFGAKKEDAVSVPKLGFGCGMYVKGDIQNSSGIIGLGRGPLSLTSQLGVTAFSYCFAEIPSKSTFFFGSFAKLTGPNVKTIPFERVLKPFAFPFSTYYHIPVKGITVGNTLLRVPPKAFQISKNGEGGMIIDSGTNFLMLSTSLYVAFADAVNAQVKLPVMEKGELKLCYHSKPNISKLVFHFDTADWEIPENNYLGHEDRKMFYCLAVLETSGVSILGNTQTLNFHVRYDLEKEELSFEPKQCDQL